jgi:sugar phosphate isomerase/epimerase
MRRFKPALCTVTFRGLLPEAIIPMARDAGLAAIEWAGDAHVPPGNAQAARGAGNLTREAGLAASYGSYVAPPTDGTDNFSQALEAARMLRASNIRIWPGTRGRDSADYRADEIRHTARLIREMAGEAALAGITVSLEFHPNSLTDTTEAALRLIETIAHDNVFLYWQPRPGLPLKDALTEIGRLGSHVSHLHVFAWDAGRNRFPLSTAADFWRTVLAAMPPSRWTGAAYAMLEFVADDAPDAFKADAATLHSIIETAEGTA